MVNKSLRAVVLLLGIVIATWLINIVVKEEVKDSYVKRAYIANSLAIASTLKTAIETYYAEHSEMPNSNYALGLPEPEEFRRDGLKGIGIEDGGVIHLTIDDKDSPKDGHIFLIPQNLSNALNDRWLCLTPSYQTISQWAPQCKYKPVEGW